MRFDRREKGQKAELGTHKGCEAPRLGNGGAVPVMGRFMRNKWRYSYVLICFNENP